MGIFAGYGAFYQFSSKLHTDASVQANVLIDDQGQPRLADFGLAQFFDSQASCAGPSFRGGGTLRWQAPELLASNSFNGTNNSCQVTTYSDVYAFAILCWEVNNLVFLFTTKSLICMNYRSSHWTCRTPECVMVMLCCVSSAARRGLLDHPTMLENLDSRIGFGSSL